jgi:hypothetical protein
MQQVSDESHVTYHNHNRPSLWQVMATTPTPTSCLTAHGLSLIKTKALSSSNYYRNPVLCECHVVCRVFFRALGKEVLCQVPNKKHSAKEVALPSKKNSRQRPSLPSTKKTLGKEATLPSAKKNTRQSSFSKHILKS